jgi:Na+-translocating ferredoxin:NAD+ oxidoreductase subunit B
LGDEAYVKLRELLHEMPGGFPATESGVEMKILKKLFTPEDAEMAVCLTGDLEPPEVIARRRGMGEREATEKLASMASRGLVYRTDDGGETRYRAEQYIVGIYEYRLGDMDREMAELVEEYMPHLGLAMAGNKTLQTRFVPVGSAVDLGHAVATYDRIRDLVTRHDVLGVKECICRKQRDLLGDPCEYPLEICLIFGDFARYHLENGWPGRRIDLGEALRLLDLSEELGLVLMAENAQEIRFVCSCCSCCCSGLRIMKALPNPADILHSNYRSVLETEACDSCGACVERCPMAAIVEEGGAITIDPKRCIGCGVCLPTCRLNAISFVEREETVVPPLDSKDTLHRILVERGLA